MALPRAFLSPPSPPADGRCRLLGDSGELARSEVGRALMTGCLLPLPYSPSETPSRIWTCLIFSFNFFFPFLRVELSEAAVDSCTQCTAPLLGPLGSCHGAGWRRRVAGRVVWSGRLSGADCLAASSTPSARSHSGTQPTFGGGRDWPGRCGRTGRGLGAHL